ncbi:MAG TPA: helix-hairpin-helix domain-containing protein [Gemmatimonadaceae bacterium]|nr:helix-hairpin-helix domain-containing protein [Gemmatimonadaceae bacterium]
MPKRLAKSRENVFDLEQIPNVGPRIAADFRKLGLDHPHSLAGANAYALYDRLNALTGVRHDPCVLDTFIAAIRYMEGSPKRAWWHYTAERKRTLAAVAGG